MNATRAETITQEDGDFVVYLTPSDDPFEVKPETAKETEARLELIMAGWAESGITQRGLASAFELRFNGQLWPDEYRFDPQRGRWMEFKAGHWTPARTILDGVGGLIERLCGDKPSQAAKWGKVAVYKDVLALAKEHMKVDQWDADGELMGLPNGEIWDLVRGEAEPNFRRLPITKTTGVDLKNTLVRPFVGATVRVTGIAFYPT